MLTIGIGHNITDGNIPSTVIGSITSGGVPQVVGMLATSPGTDLTASVVLTLVTPVGNFEIATPLSPSVNIPINIPLLLNPAGALEYSTAVTGTDGAYQLFIGVKD
jgi:hypothetical protein